MPGKPKGLSCREDAMSDQETGMLIMSCQTMRDKFIVYTLIFGGLRVSELAHLRRSWVNFDENTITVPTRGNIAIVGSALKNVTVFGNQKPKKAQGQF